MVPAKCIFSLIGCVIGGLYGGVGIADYAVAHGVAGPITITIGLIGGFCAGVVPCLEK